MRPALLCVLAFVMGCGPSFRSVRQTAELGARVGATSSAILAGPRTCELLLRAPVPAAGAAVSCEDLGARRNAETMLLAARLLAAYARALGELGQDGHFGLGSLLDLAGNVGAAASGEAGGRLSVGSVGQKLSALMAILSSGWRKGEIGRLMTKAEPQVAAIGGGLRLHVRLQREALRSLRGDGAGGGERGLLATLSRELADMATFLRCGDKDTTCRSLLRFGPLWSMGLSTLSAWAEDQERALSSFDEALAGFLLAHEVLSRRAASPGGLSDDAAIYEEIRQALMTRAQAQGGDRARSDKRD